MSANPVAGWVGWCTGCGAYQLGDDATLDDGEPLCATEGCGEPWRRAMRRVPPALVTGELRARAVAREVEWSPEDLPDSDEHPAFKDLDEPW